MLLSPLEPERHIAHDEDVQIDRELPSGTLHPLAQPDIRF
jgi:hypothetical protein